MTIVRTINSNEVDILLLRRKMIEARVETGTFSMSGSYDRSLCVKYHMAADSHLEFGILMDVGPADAPITDRWRDHGFGREPIDIVGEALTGALAPNAVRSPPDDVVMAVLGMASTLIDHEENDANVVVRCPTPWSAAHVMIGRDEPEGGGSVYRYRMHEPRDDAERRLLAALPMGTHLRSDQWTTSLNTIDVQYYPGDLDPVARLRALSAWASWRD